MLFVSLLENSKPTPNPSQEGNCQVPVLNSLFRTVANK